MRKDEEHCKNAFDEFLKTHYQDSDIAWQAGNEPPDYHLTLCGTKYAVEVTSLFQEIKLGDRTSSHLGFREAVLDFLKGIEQEARQKGILNGAYVVSYKPLNDFGKQKKSISNNIVAYLQATQSVSSAPAEKIVGNGHHAWDIEKYHSEKQYLTGTTFDVKHEHEAVDELRVLLDKVLNDKVQKLAAISYPKILLVTDRYPWVERGDWNSCLPNSKLINEFHTIFLVSHDRGNSILYSKENRWLN